MHEWPILVQYINLSRRNLLVFTDVSSVAYHFFMVLNLWYSEGGFFNAIMSFPSDYPNSPPTVRFTSEVWHPNGPCS